MNTIQTDLAVIGGGPAGLAAAAAAAEKGVKVALFEKGGTTGGAGNMGMGPFAAESRLQKIKQIDLTREKAFRIFMDYTHWRVDARLVKAYIDKSADTIDWLEKMGVEFVEPAAYFPGSNFTWHLTKPLGGGHPGPGSATALFKTLSEYAKEAGVKFYLQSAVKKIIKEGGKITGIMVENQSGEATQINCKAAIIATGGAGDNPEMIKKYIGYSLGEDIFPFRIPGLMGDGIRMAWEAGAGHEDMNMEIIYSIPMGPEGPAGVLPGHLAFNQCNLMVNLLGDRFLNEEIMGNTTFTGNAIARQKGRCAFNIFDEDTKNYFKHGLDYIHSVFAMDKLESIDADIEVSIKKGNPYIFVADTIDELAAKTGINAANLKKTIDEYNDCCEKGRDRVMDKNPRFMRPIKKPKFYAGKQYPGAYGTLGGIKINYKTEVVTGEFEPIPGLYAAGTDACSIYGDSYVFILPGNTMGFCLNSGRIAGENAAKYTKSLK